MRAGRRRHQYRGSRPGSNRPGAERVVVAPRGRGGRGQPVRSTEPADEQPLTVPGRASPQRSALAWSSRSTVGLPVQATRPYRPSIGGCGRQRLPPLGLRSSFGRPSGNRQAERQVMVEETVVAPKRLAVRFASPCRIHLTPNHAAIPSQSASPGGRPRQHAASHRRAARIRGAAAEAGGPWGVEGRSGWRQPATARLARPGPRRWAPSRWRPRWPPPVLAKLRQRSPRPPRVARPTHQWPPPAR